MSNLKEFTANVGGVPPANASDQIVVQYGYSNSFTGDESVEGYGLTKDLEDDTIKVKSSDGTKEYKKSDFLKDRKFNLYRFKGEDKRKLEANNFYEQLTGMELISHDQIKYNKDFEEITFEPDKILVEMSSVIATLEQEVEMAEIDFSKLPDDYMPLIGELEKNKAKEIVRDHPDIDVMTDNDGYFAINVKTMNRTDSAIDLNDVLLTDNVLSDTPCSNCDNYTKEAFLNCDPNSFVLATPESEKELDAQMDIFYGLTYDQRKNSDDVSIRLFGKTNSDRYEELKKQFLNQPIEYDNISIKEDVEADISDEDVQLKNSAILNRANMFGINLANKGRELHAAKEWSLNTGIYIMNLCKSIVSLEELWTLYKGMPIQLQQMSDWKLLELVGCTNETFYNFMKSHLLNTMELKYQDITLIEATDVWGNQIQDPVLPAGVPFFTPEEIEGKLKEYTKKYSTDTDCVDMLAWLDAYKDIWQGIDISSNRSKRLAFNKWFTMVNKTIKQWRTSESEEELTSATEKLLALGVPTTKFLPSDSIAYKKRLQSVAKQKVIDRILREAAINEAKDIPIEFNDYGDLLITKPEKINFDDEFFKTHRLLVIYMTAGNMDGVKFESAKLWYMNTCIESMLNKGHKDKKLIDTRARILNDYTKCMVYILNKDNNFNFTKYYSTTKFNDKVIRIKGSTLKYTLDYLKAVLFLR
jgi:hypothetical protein